MVTGSFVEGKAMITMCQEKVKFEKRENFHTMVRNPALTYICIINLFIDFYIDRVIDEFYYGNISF